MPVPRPSDLDFTDVDRLTDQLLELQLLAARPFVDLIVVNSTSPTLVVISDIDDVEHDDVIALCVDLQRRTGEAGVLACLWQTVTVDKVSIHTWIGVEPTVVHTQEVPL